MDECTAPCQRACPTGINIPGFIQEICGGNYEAALAIIKEKCPLPLICGYICPAPCEVDCRRNLIDESVAINPLKRFVSDYEMTSGKHLDAFKAPANGRKIAVVGGGAEGLTTSYYLARLGYPLRQFLRQNPNWEGYSGMLLRRTDCREKSWITKSRGYWKPGWKRRRTRLWGGISASILC